MAVVKVNTPQLKCGSVEVGDELTVTSEHNVTARNTSSSPDVVTVSCSLIDATSGDMDEYFSSYTIEPGEVVELLGPDSNPITLRLDVSYQKVGPKKVTAITRVTGENTTPQEKRASCSVIVVNNNERVIPKKGKRMEPSKRPRK